MILDMKAEVEYRLDRYKAPAAEAPEEDRAISLTAYIARREELEKQIAGAPEDKAAELRGELERLRPEPELAYSVRFRLRPLPAWLYDHLVAVNAGETGVLDFQNKAQFSSFIADLTLFGVVDWNEEDVVDRDGRPVRPEFEDYRIGTRRTQRLRDWPFPDRVALFELGVKVMEISDLPTLAAGLSGATSSGLRSPREARVPDGSSVEDAPSK